MKNRMKKGSSMITLIVVIVLVVALCVGAYFLVSSLYEKKLNQNGDVNNNSSQDNTQDTSKNDEEEISSEPLYTLDNYPKVDASLATQPLTNAFIKNFVGEDVDVSKLDYTNTHPGYVRLINDEVDLIVVTEPSKEELELAKQKGVELEVIPVVKEGFVFYVNSNNKVDYLTKDQIQGIYSGEITNWKEVGGEDMEIKPFQRPTNSGSQTGMLSLVMKDKKLMDPLKENLVSTMAQIINFVSSYENGKNSIGYSYYYYATTMYEGIDKEIASNIKLIGIDGVKPNAKTIQNGSYPYTTAYYIVINKADDENSPSRKLANLMLSKRGQQVAKNAGYVPVK
ncbi:putative periplasmic phosphate-binding protein [Clostridium sp. CAG:921]|nr:putative periplasmic phosphate-binding protein [Clostridium sp. CAG:921]